MKADHIAGRTVKSAATVHDYMQIYFDDGTILNIFNRIRAPAIDDILLAGLVHETVSDEIACADTILLRFSSGKSLEIGMSDADYRGPEALELIESDGKRIVWS